MKVHVGTPNCNNIVLEKCQKEKWKKKETKY